MPFRTRSPSGTHPSHMPGAVPVTSDSSQDWHYRKMTKIRTLVQVPFAILESLLGKETGLDKS